MIRSSYLRVYLPASRLGRYPVHEGLPSRLVFEANEHVVWGESATDDAFRVEHEGRAYLCPRSARLRMLEGVLAFANAYPMSALLPERTVGRAASQLEELRSASPAARSYILTSPWHVPLRWFLPFVTEQRVVYESAAGTSIRYRTLLGRGRPRVHRATDVLDEAGFDDSVVDQVRDLGHWLDEFTSEALLELDYAGVGSLFAPGELAIDESAADVAASIEALRQGDYDAAGHQYAKVASRWANAQALTFSN
jgi:hypothetical protein